jgi:hypothetical protein
MKFLVSWKNMLLFRYAEYQSFTVADAESKYRLDINGYSGDAGLFTKTI